MKKEFDPNSAVMNELVKFCAFCGAPTVIVTHPTPGGSETFNRCTACGREFNVEE